MLVSLAPLLLGFMLGLLFLVLVVYESALKHVSLLVAPLTELFEIADAHL